MKEGAYMASNFVENDKLNQLLRKWALSDNIRYVSMNRMSKQIGINNNDIRFSNKLAINDKR